MSLVQKLRGLKPLEQIYETCWLYSIVHLINHSKILKKNIKYAVASDPQLLKDAFLARQNVFKGNKNVCGIKRVYYSILEDISLENILWSNIANFVKHIHPEENTNLVKNLGISNLSKTQQNELIKLVKNRNSKAILYVRRLNIPQSNKLKILNKLNYTKRILSVHRSSILSLYKILDMFGLPHTTISLEPKPGYTLEGSIIRVNGNHFITGVFDRFKTPYILNSVGKKVIKENWTKSQNYEITKIYVKKLYV